MMTLKIGKRMQAEVATFAEASRIYSQTRNESGEGASTFPVGRLLRELQRQGLEGQPARSDGPQQPGFRQPHHGGQVMKRMTWKTFARKLKTGELEIVFWVRGENRADVMIEDRWGNRTYPTVKLVGKKADVISIKCSGCGKLRFDLDEPCGVCGTEDG